MVLDWFWERLGIILGSHFGYLYGLCEKCSTYENAVNSSRIEGGALRKTTKKLPEGKRENGMRTKTKTD